MRAFVNGIGYSFVISHGAAPQKFKTPLTFSEALQADAVALAGDWNRIGDDLHIASVAFSKEYLKSES
jgi:hypothetical protein